MKLYLHSEEGISPALTLRLKDDDIASQKVEALVQVNREKLFQSEPTPSPLASC